MQIARCKAVNLKAMLEVMICCNLNKSEDPTNKTDRWRVGGKVKIINYGVNANVYAGCNANNS